MIIANKRNGRRRIIVYGRWTTRVNFIWLDPTGSWGTMEDSQFYSQYMYAVSLTKYESYIMGGKTNWHGDVTSRYCILFSNYFVTISMM